MHPLPLMRRPRSSYSHRLSWPIFWLIFLEPSLSPGPCLPACRTHTCRPPAPYCHITECCQQKCCHITECVQSDKPVGGGKSHRVHFERASSSKIELAAFFTQVLATPRSASRRAARGTMDRTQSDWPGGRDTKEYLGHKKKVHSLAWNCSGEKLASGSVDQSVRSEPSAAVLQLPHPAMAARWRRSIQHQVPRLPRRLAHRPGNLLRSQVRVWALDPSGRSTGTELKGHQDSVDQLRWDPKQPEVLGTASADKTVRIWDARSGKCANAIETKGENINIRWSPDGQHIAVATSPSPAPSPYL